LVAGSGRDIPLCVHGDPSTKIKRYILRVVCCGACEVLEDAFLLVVEIFDSRGPFLAVAP